MRELASGLRFPEGPVALQDGTVLVCEVAGGTIARVGDGLHEVVAEVGGGPNGAAIGPDGRLYITNNGGIGHTVENGHIKLTGMVPPDYAGGSIQALDLDSGVLETIATDCDGETLSGPNDLVFDASGGCYFTDTGRAFPRYRTRGGLFYIALPDPTVRRVVWPLEMPNGVGLSPAGDRVYVAEMNTARLWFWDIVEPGVVRPGHTPHASTAGRAGGTLLHSPGGFSLFDSLAVDGLGHVCVATLMRGVITVITPDGRVEEIIRPPEHDDHVTNLCFGAPDLRTTYVTSGGLGKVYAFRWPWPVLRLAFAR